MNIIRSMPPNQQYRFLECFWESQLTSKGWLINVLESLSLKEEGDVYIFGGWFGILASLIKDSLRYEVVNSIDVDLNCKSISETNNIDSRINFITCDMKEFEYKNNKIGLIINTSTEHVNQETFDTWLSKIPNNIPIVLQGNNFYECEEHIRCSSTLEHFKKINPLNIYIYSGELECYGPNGPFKRFMSIGYTHAN
jgi:hypothetical protein